MKQKQIIGIIGGMGPQASCELYRLLIDGARLRYGARNNDDYPEVLIDSVPVPDFLSDTGSMESAACLLEDRVRSLTSFGVSSIAMACNTACILAGRLQRQTNVPFVSIIDAVVGEVEKANTSVLLLASPTSLRLRLYQKKLADSCIPYTIPHTRDYCALEQCIRGVIDGAERTSLTRVINDIARRYTEKSSINAILLGCTELPLIFPGQFPLPVYSSLSILAESILKQYYKEVI